MIILENSFLTGLFLALHLVVLGFLGFSYLRKKYQYSFYGMLIQIAAGLIYFFVCYLNGDFFSLSIPHDFTANLIYLISISSGVINAFFSLKMYHQHRVVSAIMIQLGLFFAAILIVTQLSDTAYLTYRKRKLAGKIPQQRGFNTTDDFGQK